MAQLIIMGAQAMCSFGTKPASFVVTPENLVNGTNKPAATIMDNVPMKNITPFGMCTSLANPTVASATTAAQGVLTPQPCIPVVPAPWVPGSPTVLLSGKPALNNTSTCNCTWAGVISFTNPGQMTINVP